MCTCDLRIASALQQMKAPAPGALAERLHARPGAHGGNTRAGAGPLNPAAGAEERLPFTLSQLVAFCTLARAGSFRAAALALSVSQPAVSKSIALLEQAGCPVCWLYLRCRHACYCLLHYRRGNSWLDACHHHP